MAGKILLLDELIDSSSSSSDNNNINEMWNWSNSKIKKYVKNY